MVYLKRMDEPDLALAEGQRLMLGDDLFRQARNLFRDTPELRGQCIPVSSPDGDPLPFAVAWKRNLSTDLPEDMLERMPFYVSDFWDYDPESTHLDFDFVERGQVFIFEDLEEYSYTAACLIQAWYPDRYIFFKDPLARYFFRETELLHVIRDDAELCRWFHYLIPYSIYSFSSEVFGINPSIMDIYTPEQFLSKRYLTLDLMTSLFWLSGIQSYGDLHPDKIFCVIRNPLGMEGLGDMLRYCIYRAEVVSQKGGNLVPVIDLSVPGDGNQFNGGDGSNVWTMFFRQICPIPLEEVYRSRNVIAVQDHLLSMNPYIQEQIYFDDLSALMESWVHYSDTTRDYVERLYADTIPNPDERVLGVVGRGSDYNIPSMEGILNRPAGPEALLDRVRQLIAEHGFQRVFLATEDETVFRTFMTSELADRICSVDQPRISFKAGEEKFLVDVYKEENRDGYRDNLRYLGIIHILSRCNALLSSTNCGAHRLAIGFNHHRYEFTEVYDKKQAGA